MTQKTSPEQLAATLAENGIASQSLRNPLKCSLPKHFENFSPQPRSNNFSLLGHFSIDTIMALCYKYHNAKCRMLLTAERSSHNLRQKPNPLKWPVGLSAERRLNCPFYPACLIYASRLNWLNWRCACKLAHSPKKGEKNEKKEN